MAAKRKSLTISSRSGLSLLELVLALMLSVLVIGLVTLAIRFQMKTFEQRRDRVEQAVLARSILRHMSVDLQSAVAYRPMDLTGVSTVTSNASQSLSSTGLTGTTGTTGTANSTGGTTTQAAGSTGGTGAGNGASLTTPMGSTTGSQPGATSGQTTSATGQTGTMGSNGTTSTAATQTGAIAGKGDYVAGLYGDQYSLTFDMTRLPRLDEYASIVANNVQDAIVQVPSDIRTVSYYLAGSSPMTQATAAASRQAGMASLKANSLRDPSAALSGSGLVRQERDRSLASYSQVAVDYSKLSQDTGEELLAEEVTRLEFRYFDGYEWWPDWDSDQRGGLPVAVEIVVGLADRKLDTETATTTASANNPSDVPQELTYRLVVRIATAEPLDPSEMQAAEEESTSSSSTNSPSSPMGATTGSTTAPGVGGGS